MTQIDGLTERSDRVLKLALREAEKAGSAQIGTDHLLLALVDEGGGAAARILKAFKLDRKRIVGQIERLCGAGSEGGGSLASKPITYTSRMGNVFTLARSASKGIGSDCVGTEHLLIGLIDESEGIAHQIMAHLAVPMDLLRDTAVKAAMRLYAIGRSQEGIDGSGNAMGKRSVDAFTALLDAAIAMGMILRLRNTPSREQFQEFERMIDDAQDHLVEIGVLCPKCRGGGDSDSNGDAHETCDGCQGKGRLI